MRELTEKEREQLGSFNDPLPNLKGISEEDFWSELFQRVIIVSTTKQVTKDERGGPHRRPHRMEEYKVFITTVGPAGPEGIAILKGVERARAVPKGFYTFTCCDHDWGPPKNPRGWRCYREYRCKKCGMVHAIDSSD